jgi:hypothetical protein
MDFMSNNSKYGSENRPGSSQPNRTNDSDKLSEQIEIHSIDRRSGINQMKGFNAPSDTTSNENNQMLHNRGSSAGKNDELMYDEGSNMDDDNILLDENSVKPDQENSLYKGSLF